ncbi:MAG: hemerythrin domain-containing protein [Nitrosospira sp.]|nr:hemerythrin domain-containing protein [Nitrosospira sp.]MDN5881565.1 hemerythrin domain-containing protein [Nitrosospira sp.]MDN5935605.1 hemerythrin domain-containing protein [Nitrosospira sp.]
MPRTGALLSLSREHHVALVMARTARRAASENENDVMARSAAMTAAVASIEAHWHTSMAAHFEKEERLMRIARDTLDPQTVTRILAEHAELRILAAGPCALEPAARLRRFADLISAHVRHEERTLFPQLQSHPCVADADS